MRRCTLAFMTLLLFETGPAGAAELRPRAVFPKPPAATIDPDQVDPGEIIVKFHEGTRVRLHEGRLTFEAGRLTEENLRRLARNALTEDQVVRDVARANELLLSQPEAGLFRLFARPEEVLERERAELELTAGEELADLDLYYMRVLRGAEAYFSEGLINELNGLPSVEIAYAEPWPQVAAADIAPITNFDLTSSQGYLRRAGLGGIDADWSWRLPGGRGAGMRVEDVELGWIVDHEDLPGTYFAQNGWSWSYFDHGTAVLGEIAAADNGYGATGITPDVAIGLSSPVWANWYSPHDTAAAIDNAAAALRRGDVLIIEQHYPESTPPGSVCSCNCGQFGYLPMEGVQAVFDAVRRATAKGVIVVAAAGNGSMNLDDPFYNGRFNRSVRDSGAILVGANAGGGNLNAACFSNFGSRVDLMGWGGGVATLGYGPLNPDPNDDWRQRYTTGFSGTSSATPIVAGAALAVNGSRRAEGDPLFDSIAMRQWLVATGTPQPTLSAATTPIGPQPDLRRALPAVAGRQDGIDGNGVANGWAFHSSTTNSIAVHFYVDGPAGGGGAWGGATTANVSRPDVNSFFGITGDHGFAFYIPDAFRDDSTHTLFAYGIDPTWRVRNRELEQRLTFNLPNVKGVLDGVDSSSGRVWGWTYAAQQPTQSLTLHVYLDGPYPTGQFLGAWTANTSRPDVNAAFGIMGDHGFDFTLPTSVWDGLAHTLYVYAIDPRGVNNRLLGSANFLLPALVRKLSLTVTRVSATTTDATIIAYAKDQMSGVPVTGTVTIDGVVVGQTGQLVTYTLLYETECFEECFERSFGKPPMCTTVCTQDLVPSQGKVTASGYQTAYFTP